MIALVIIQFITFRSAGQMTMPDHVCTGQTRHYYVIPGPVTRSTYTWWVDGSAMSGFNASEFIYTWNSSKTYLLEVQERSADGCPGPKKSGQVFVNPQPEIQISASDSLICDGESVTVSVQNPSGLIWGKWIYDLIVEPEAGIIGNTINGTYTSPTDLNETLYNNDKEVHKVIYRFIPRIVTDDGVLACEGKEVKITLWIHPVLRYKKEVSDYNGFNISCHGKSDGFIRIDPLSESADLTFIWNGPNGFTATSEYPEGLKAGQYSLTIIGSNRCSVADTFKLTEPDPLQITFEIKDPYCPGSHDGAITLDVTGGVSGSEYNYDWSDNSTGKDLLNVPQGSYKVIVIDLNGCSAHDNIILSAISEACLEIPDAFSPNGDGINDVWNIKGIHLYPSAMITIYNRWGQSVWKSERGYPVPWDGRSRGEDLPIDSYHYIIDLHNGSKPIVGAITIIR